MFSRSLGILLTIHGTAYGTTENGFEDCVDGLPRERAPLETESEP